jgi:glycosyltransferase involved in cell wall biosynthesis
MKIWIVQTGEPLHCDGGSLRPMRAMNLANTLTARGHDVTIWSSDFYHQAKRHRNGKFVSISYNQQLTINLIPSPGYYKNIGLGRLFDHAVLAYRLRRLLRATDLAVPDVAFVGYPPIEVASVAIKWCKAKGVPCIVDIKDQWPTLFLEAVPKKLRLVVRAALFPYFWAGKVAVKTADVRCSMSRSYMKWISRFSGRPESTSDIIAPLTVREPVVLDTELRSAREWWAQHGVDLSKKNKFIFVGSFMSVFDFNAIRDAAYRLSQQGVDCQFVICGSGGSELEIKQLMANTPNVVFPGWIDLPKIISLADSAVAALIPYKNIENFTLNIPNKIVDALALGLPIISTLDGEVGALIRENCIGYCEAGADGERLAIEMDRMLRFPESTRDSGKRAQKIYRDRFDFDAIYGSLADRIEAMSVRV